MSKFHVGDRVRFSIKTGRDNYLDGKTGLVTQTGYGFWDYIVKMDENGSQVGAKEVDLRPADIFAQNPGEFDSISAIQEAVDNVNHPPHYEKYPVEVIEITEQLDFNKGNAVKYILRAGHKAGVDELEDLSKAAWYINRAIEKLKKERESDV